MKKGNKAKPDDGGVREADEKKSESEFSHFSRLGGTKTHSSVAFFGDDDGRSSAGCRFSNLAVPSPRTFAETRAQVAQIELNSSTSDELLIFAS